MPSLDAQMRAAISAAREDSLTDSIMSGFEWSLWLMLFFCLAPSLKMAWKSEKIRQLSRSIRWGWLGWFLSYLWISLIAPLLVVWLTGKDILIEAFPSSRSILGFVLLGWLPATCSSVIACSLSILWRSIRSLSKA